MMSNFITDFPVAVPALVQSHIINYLLRMISLSSRKDYLAHPIP